MAQITFIGAGSRSFTRRLVRDVLTFPELRDSTITLMDIDAERLEQSREMTETLIEANDLPTRVEATTDRKEALEGSEDALRQAIKLDPLTSAVCTLEEVDEIVDELLAANAASLPARS